MFKIINRKFYIEQINNVFHSNKIWILIWPRRVWKTFLMNLFYEKFKKDAVWYSFEEDIGIKFDTVESFLNFLKLKTWKETFKYIFLDEIQLVVGISWILKKIYDSWYDFKILVSGSGSFKIFSEIEDSLVGRLKIINVYPLTFEEFFEFKTGKSLDFVFQNYTEIIYDDYKYLLEEFLKFWWYPEVVLATDESSKLSFLKDIYDMWINKDIKLILTWEDIVNLSKILKGLAMRIRSIIKLQTLAGEIGTTFYKVRKIIEILKQSFVIFSLPPLAERYSPEVRTGEKIYFFDNGLLNYILWNFQIVSRWELIENYVISEIKKISNPGIRLYFWKKRNQSEIDLVLKNILKNEYIPVEIKYKVTDVLPKIFLSFRQVYGVSKWILFNQKIFKTRKIDDFELKVLPYMFANKILSI